MIKSNSVSDNVENDIVRNDTTIAATTSSNVHYEGTQLQTKESGGDKTRTYGSTVRTISTIHSTSMNDDDRINDDDIDIEEALPSSSNDNVPILQEHPDSSGTFTEQRTNDNSTKVVTLGSGIDTSTTTIASHRSNNYNENATTTDTPNAISSNGMNFGHDEDSMFRKILTDTGRWAYGIKVIEVWVMNSDNTFLFRPEYGYWVDPIYSSHSAVHDTMTRLFGNDSNDTNNKNHAKSSMPATIVTPGEGLPGLLWSEVTGNAKVSQYGGSNSIYNARASFGIVGSGGGSSASVLRQHHPRRMSLVDTVKTSMMPQVTNRIVWRDVHSLANDPDQPWNERLHVMASAGLGWAAGIPFAVPGSGSSGTRGIVIYMARDTGVDMNRVRSTQNEDYLLSATEFIGASYAYCKPREQMIRLRQNEMMDVWHRVRRKVLLLVKVRGALKDIMLEKSEHEGQNGQADKEKGQGNGSTMSFRLMQNSLNRVVLAVKKTRGGGMQVPPPFTWNQTLLTFIGVFITMFVITTFNKGLEQTLGQPYTIPLPPFGAFVALQFGLTSAPAAQPRNAVFGQIVSIVIGFGFSYCQFLPVGIRQALAASFAIGAMVKLSLIHPPAGAAAVVYATGKYSWFSVLFYMIGNIICIFFAAFINNLSNKRQYPSYWGIPFIDEEKFHSSRRSLSSKIRTGVAKQLRRSIARKHDSR